MLKISEEQVAVLRARLIEEFEDRLVMHLHEALPRQFERLGEERVRGEVRLALTRAPAYGITSELGICLWAEVSLLHGPDFDRRQPWAAEILRHAPGGGEEELQQGNERMAKLYAEAAEHPSQRPESITASE